MTREEEINKAKREYASKRLANHDFPTYNAEYELEAAFDEGAEWADRIMIKKACEYLEEYTPQKFEDVQNYVENFRKAMKGE